MSPNVCLPPGSSFVATWGRRMAARTANQEKNQKLTWKRAYHCAASLLFFLFRAACE